MKIRILIVFILFGFAYSAITNSEVDEIIAGEAEDDDLVVMDEPEISDSDEAEPKVDEKELDTSEDENQMDDVVRGILKTSKDIGVEMWADEILERVSDYNQDVLTDYIMDIMKQGRCTEWPYSFQVHLADILSTANPSEFKTQMCSDVNLPVTEYMGHCASILELVNIMVQTIYDAHVNPRSDTTLLTYLNPQKYFQFLDFFIPLPSDAEEIFARIYHWRRPNRPSNPNLKPSRPRTSNKDKLKSYLNHAASSVN